MGKGEDGDDGWMRVSFWRVEKVAGEKWWFGREGGKGWRVVIRRLQTKDCRRWFWIQRAERCGVLAGGAGIRRVCVHDLY